MKKYAAIVAGISLVLLALFLPGCNSRVGRFFGSGASESLIHGKAASKSTGVRRDALLTDNVAAPRADFWKSELTAIFSSAQAFVEWDLGKSTPIRAAYLQGDDNDIYTLSISEDGASFTPIWEARPSGGGGLQARSTDTLQGQGRYIRITAGAGDGSYAVSELQVFSQKPAVWPPNPQVRDSLPPDEVLRSKILIFGLALAVAVALAYKGAPIWWTFALAILPLAAGFDAYRALVLAWPPGTREVALVRGVFAAVGCLIVLRETFSPPRFLADRRVSVAALGLCAVMASAAFYNLGSPQFHDYKNDKPGFVHNFDMRVYFPIAKYFKELRFDGLYLGSVAAYVDDDKSVTLHSLAFTQLRSLKTHRMVKVSESEADIKEVRSRFTDARWQDFKRDMRYFRENMGVRDYLGSMSDHGGNATPVWFLFGHLMFANAHANNTTLTITAMLDPLLLLIAFGCVWRAFGFRTMLVCAIVFGANDFYMFGTCWAGATLRHDWMAYLCIGICMLKLERWSLAGVFLMLSGLIRAFPFFALVGAAIPTMWWLYEHVRANKKLPSIALIKEKQGHILKVALAALITGVVLFLASSAMFGFRSWPEWLHKVSMLQRDPHVNHVSLRALIGGPDGIHTRVMAARQSVYIAAIATFALMVFFSARKKHISQAATLGTLMIPIAFHPANYYIHFIFVLPLLAIQLRTKKGEEAAAWPIKPADAMFWVVLLLLCAAEYGAAIEKDLGLHFYYSSAMIILAVTTILVMELVREYNLGAQLLPAGLPLPVGGAPPIPIATEPEPAPPSEDLPAAAAPVSEAPTEGPTTDESPAQAAPPASTPTPEVSADTSARKADDKTTAAEDEPKKSDDKASTDEEPKKSDDAGTAAK